MRMQTFLVVTSPIVGCISLVVVFALCFVSVHLLRLARLGRIYQKQQKQAVQMKTDEKQNSPDKKPEEPIYYIVERKRKVKSNFSTPKQIHFK